MSLEKKRLEEQAVHCAELTSERGPLGGLSGLVLIALLGLGTSSGASASEQGMSAPPEPDENAFMASLGNYTQVVGTSGNDVITLDDRNFLVIALDGDDRVYTGNGSSRISGGNGNDYIQVGDSSNWISAEEGNDTIFAGHGNNRISGGNGDDSITVGNGDNYITAEDGNDFIEVGNGKNFISGGSGDDYIILGVGENYVLGEDGNDSFVFNGGTAFISGGSGNDTYTINPNPGSLFIRDEEGYDRLYLTASHPFMAVFPESTSDGGPVLVIQYEQNMVYRINCINGYPSIEEIYVNGKLSELSNMQC